ncbi:PAS domain S-box protein [Paraburkholderia sp.]|uniref:sensor histidine kinase n=1 Tax=Paraburkholderia sp. TaxID=1926495 RepID=UPI003C7A370F
MNIRREKISSAAQTVESLQLELDRCRRELNDCLKRAEYTDGLLAHLADTVLVADPDGRIVDVHPATCSLLGYTRDDLSSIPLWDFVTSHARHEILDLAQGPVPEVFVASRRNCLSKDGNPRPLDLRLARYAVGGRDLIVATCRTDFGLTQTPSALDDPQRAEALLGVDKRILELISREDPLPSILDAFRTLVEENDRLREDFRDLFDEAPIPYVHEGLDSHFIRANRAAMNVLGIVPEDIAGTFGETFVANSPENQQRLREAFESVGQGKETAGVVLELVRKDGTPIWVQWWSKPAPNRNYTRTMMVDITDRVLMEQTKTALEFTLESGQVGDWDLDLVHDTSRRSLRHDQCFGYNACIPDTQWSVKTFLQHVHPTDRARVETTFRLAVEALSDWESEFRVVWPDQSIHWIVARGRVYQSKEGRATRMLGVVMDITERKRVEEALRETQAALQFTLEAAKVGDWDLDLIHDTSHRSLRHDQCFGYNTPIPDAAWGIEVFIRHVHAIDRERVETTLRQAAQGLLDWSSEFRVVWPDHSEHWLAACGRVYQTKEGVATRMLGIVMDITERKRAEEALSASEEFARGQVEVLTHTLDALSMESAPDRLAEHVVRTLTEQLGAHSSSVWRKDEPGGPIEFEFAFEGGSIVTKSDAALAGVGLSMATENNGPLAEVFRTGKHTVANLRDLRSSPWRDRLLSLGIVIVLAVPMAIGGRVQAVISLRFTRRRVFRAEEIELAHALANQAMLTMQLARLSARSRQSAVIAERNRMARDIHDTLAQGFTGVIVQLQAAEDARGRALAMEADQHLKRAGDLARESLKEARRSMQALRPQALDEKDLCEALDTLFKKMTAGTDLQCEFTQQGQARLLPPEWDQNLLRIGQEVLTNVLRHAKANHFSAEIAFEPERIRLVLRDTGCGFDPTAKREGFGLLGIAERVECMGGRLTVESAPGMGTAILISLPFSHDSTTAWLITRRPGKHS